MATGAKTKTRWFCTSCGNESPKWMGRCPACGEWNTMVEETVVTGKKSSVRGESVPGAARKPVRLPDIDSSAENRVSLGNAEVDRILGGGLVQGSLVLIGGEPGIGKSTLSLQIPLGCPSLKTLYVTGEESARQVKMRADRLGGDTSNCLIFSETLMERILEEAESTAWWTPSRPCTPSGWKVPRAPFPRSRKWRPCCCALPKNRGFRSS